jgi:DNA mismatch repair protein MutS2
VHTGTLRRGHRVWIQRLHAEADVLDVLPSGHIRVAAGPLKLTVAASDVLSAAHQASSSDVKSQARKSHAVDPASSRSPIGSTEQRPIRASDNTCDLRGLRVDDGLAMATTFLDRALSEGHRHIFLVHGHGTGALRDALRKELAASPYVARFEPSRSDRGGDGVTIVWLA